MALCAKLINSILSLVAQRCAVDGNTCLENPSTHVNARANGVLSGINET